LNNANLASTQQILQNRNLRLLLAEGFLALVFYTACSASGGSSFLLAFLKTLGATPVDIGILAAIPAVSVLVQVLASYFLEKGASTKAVCFWGNFLAKCSWIMVPLIPLLIHGSHSLVVSGILTCALISTFLWAFGTNGYVSWNVALIPSDVRGRFAAIKNLVCQVVAVTVLLGAGKVLSLFPGKATYMWLFGIGTLFGIASTIPFRLLPDGPRVQGSCLGLVDTIVTPFHDANFRRFLISLAVFAFANSLIGAFSVNFMLDEFKTSIFFISTMDSISISVATVFAFFWGRFSDTYGHRIVLKICLWGICGMPLVWLICTAGNYRIVVPLLYGVASIFWSGIGLAQYNLMLELVPPSGNAKYFSAASLAGGVMGMAGSLIAGYFIKNGPSLIAAGSPGRAFFALCLFTVVFRISAAIIMGGVREPTTRPRPEIFSILDRINPFAEKG
jgi:hypothetical protein